MEKESEVNFAGIRKKAGYELYAYKRLTCVHAYIRTYEDMHGIPLTDGMYM